MDKIGRYPRLGSRVLDEKRACYVCVDDGGAFFFILPLSHRLKSVSAGDGENSRP